MDKKFFISTVAVFVAAMAVGFVVHGTLLEGDYAALASLYRPKEEHMQFCVHMILAHVLMSGALVWIYRRGRENKPFIGQGVRFGLGVAMLSTIPMYLIYYAVQPLPGMMVAKQIIFDTIGMLILGVLVAWLEKPAGAA